jgi:DNA-binding NarL/FixJ family response regulator
MTDKRIYCCGGDGGTATVARKPRAVVVGNSLFAANAADQFRRLGWDVCTIANADELATLVLAKKPNAVILPIQAGAESGHLVAAKLKKARPKLKVVLVAEKRSGEAERFAKFVGAGFAVESDGGGRVAAGIVG